jgi:hypothetical protein
MSSESLQTQAFKKRRFVDDFRTALPWPEELVSTVCSLMASFQCQLSDEGRSGNFSFARGKSHAPLFNVFASDCSAQVFLWMNSADYGSVRRQKAGKAQLL